MELLAAGSSPRREDVVRTFRYSILPSLLLCAGMYAAAGLAVVAGAPRLRELSLLGWSIALPLLLFGSLLWLLIAWMFTGMLVSSLRSTNWLMKVTRDGLYLNVRSYLNGHFGGDAPTVAVVSFAQVQTARKLVVLKHTRDAEGHVVERRSYLELDLGSTDTSALAEVVREERVRPAPARSCLGLKVHSRANHEPVVVPHPGFVLVDWKWGMRSALEGRARLLETARRRDGDSPAVSRPAAAPADSAAEGRRMLLNVLRGRVAVLSEDAKERRRPAA